MYPSCTPVLSAGKSEICDVRDMRHEIPTESRWSMGPRWKRRRERGKREEEWLVMSEPGGRVEKKHSESMRADEEQWCLVP